MESGTPFFGAKISLISKSEIRYEGILYTIDPKESTIALAKVRSFGTENRQAERPVPPRDEIFEFIIFRASDIKDLVVDDAPGQTQTPAAPPVFEDPAIVKSSDSSLPGSSSIQPATSTSQAQSSKPTENGQASQTESTKKSQPSSQTAKPAWGGVNLHNNANSQSQQNRNQQHQNRPNNQIRQFEQRGNNFQGNRNGGFRPQGQGFRQQGFNQQGRYNNNRMGGGFQRSNRGMGRGGFQPRNNGSIKFAPLPDGEFDFEKAHSDFQMLEEKLKALKLNGENGEPADLPPIEGIPASAITVSALEKEEDIPSEPGYNKTRSFFDNISCEAVEREKGIVKRVDWKAERSLNKETFGVSSARPNQRYFNNRRGGYGFNNRGGGFNRGRGNYNNNNRRYNNQQNRQSSGNAEPAQASPSVEASA